ncbi:MAG TPA: Hsp70 family protein [Thermoanaerobaculia bacterium]
MSAKTWYIGIDLGTTNSTVAAFDGESVTLVRNAQGATLTPSVVRLDGKGNATVGAKARRYLESDPENARGEFKRLMGTAQEIPFAAAGVQWKPERLAALVLRSLRDDVREQLGIEPVQAVISVPALFELPQSAATAEAARLAGFEKVELIQEPVASALAAGWSADDSAGKWLVYDLGGGTFDASLLETQDGHLRVVDHDGDNFLGGRDIDNAIADWALAELERTEGVAISRADPQHQAALRKLKQAAEEAKIELTRAARTSLTIDDFATVDGRRVDLDLTLDRATLETLLAPLAARSIAVCERVLAQHGLAKHGSLERVVLVGGPTAIPALRHAVAEALGAPFGEGLDPMTLVAQGAAIYAATTGLSARPAPPPANAAHRFRLQYPGISSDLSPHVLGRLAAGGDGPAPASVALVRDDGLFRTADIALDGDGAFVAQVELLPRRPNLFRLEARERRGAAVAVEPAAFTIVQGLTIADPPLSRTIGIALADDTVRDCFGRGTPLPARRTVTQRTVESVAPGSGQAVLKIPIVQGEFPAAHLCRLVGTLEIDGAALTATLPAGSTVEITLEVDRGGRFSASAWVPAANQMFTQVAHLIVPEATPEVLAAALDDLRGRLSSLRAGAFSHGNRALLAELGSSEAELLAIERDVAAATGGDADAAQKARRSLLELEARLQHGEEERSWPELRATSHRRFAAASNWVAEYGTPVEQRMLTEAGEALERAHAARQAAEVSRQLRLVSRLGNAAFFRHPEAWSWEFDHVASRAGEATDLPAAQRLIDEGRKAQERNDAAALRSVVERLRKLLPAEAEERRLSYDSGVR